MICADCGINEVINPHERKFCPDCGEKRAISMEAEILSEVDRKKIKNHCFICQGKIARKPPDRILYYMKYGNCCLDCNRRVNGKMGKDTKRVYRGAGILDVKRYGQAV